MSLTKQQQKALALDKNISVTAGAGSGKTKILVERFLKIALQNPAKVRNILAITFTKKAAGEMQERVAGDVNRRLNSDISANKRSKLLLIRDQLSQASISTIHGFCSRVLREFPIEAGLSPDFSEMDDLQQRVAMHGAIDAVFEQVDQNDGYNYAWFFSLLDKAAVCNLLEFALQSPYEMNHLRQRISQLSAEAYLEFLKNQWLQLVQEYILSDADYHALLTMVRAIISSDGLPHKNEKGQMASELLHKTNALDIENKLGAKACKAILELSEFFTGSKGAPLKSSKNFGGKESWDKHSTELLIELSALCADIEQRKKENNPGIPDDKNDLIWFELLKQFLALFEETEVLYNQEKAGRGWLDFEDLQILTLRLLQNDQDIRRQLTRRFDYIMVDEFQDTNALQWEIVSLLAGGGDALAKDKVFIVGDPKQSIYGFRDADIRIFKQVKEKFARLIGDTENSGNIVFTDSFRFLPRLNSFINHLFSEILQENSANPFEVEYHPLNAMRQVADTGWAELALLDEPDNEEEYIAQRISQIMANKTPVYLWEDGETERPIQYGDIAILLRARNSLLKIELALRKYDIPYKTVKGIGFWQKQEVYDFYHLLRFLSNPQDDLALIGALRSSLFLISDETLYFLSQTDGAHYFQKMIKAVQVDSGFPKKDIEPLKYVLSLLRKWLSLRDRLPLMDLFEIVLEDLQLGVLYSTQINGEQLLANIEKLMQQAQHFDISGFGGLNEFVKYMEELIEKGMREGEAQIILEDSGSVKIMTIHAAKGLQFPVVFVPYLNTENSKIVSDYYLDSEFGLALKSKFYGANSNLLYNLLQQRQKQKELAEAKRLFYVAVSRASNRVYLSALAKQDIVKKNSALKWMHQVFDSLFEQDIIQVSTVDSFELSVQRRLETAERKQSDYQNFTDGMQALAKTLENVPTASAEIPDYLQKIPPGSGSRIFSPTRLMIFKKDKQEYYRKYHLGFFDDDYEVFAEDIQRDEYGLLKGKIVHRYLEMTPESGVADTRLIEQILFEFEVFDVDLQHRFMSELQQLKNQIRTSDTAKKIIFAAQARNELGITICIGQDYLTGTLDRIIQTNAGQWEVIDYKTNRIGSGQIEQESERYKLQMQAYALLMSKIYSGQDEYKVSLYFLHPDELFEQKYNKKNLQEIESSFIEIIRQIKEEFPVN